MIGKWKSRDSELPDEINMRPNLPTVKDGGGFSSAVISLQVKPQKPADFPFFIQQKWERYAIQCRKINL